MPEKKQFTLQTLIVCILFNALLIGAFFFTTTQGFQQLHQWIDPVLRGVPQDMSREALTALSNIDAFLRQRERLLLVLVLGLGGLITLLLWLTVQFLGRRFMEKVAEPATITLRPKKEPQVKEVAKPKEEPRASLGPVIQMLRLLQREGRFIDFIKENLDAFDDKQVGAAVRTIHDGCKKVFAKHVALKAIVEEEEGSEVTVKPGFDAHSIRLTGNVKGKPPFQGVLRHHGWQVEHLDLPQPVAPHEMKWILEPAEVEVGE